MAGSTGATLDMKRHIKYWTLCARLLPEQYTSSDANRMSFGFFIVAALDLLDVLDTVISESERRSWIEWIYACQVPHTGGFRGFTGTNLGGLRSPMNWHWDPASLPNTYFALATLTILGDDLSRVSRNECLRWISRLQAPDGSFGEFFGPEGEVVGGSDPRLCLCAVGTLKLLGADQTTASRPWNDIDQFRLRQFIANCQGLEGGIGEAPLLEAHSGLTYCGIATLSFLSLLSERGSSVHDVADQAGLATEDCARWMLDRQTTWIEDDEEEDSNDDEADQNRQTPVHAPSDASPIGDPDMIAGFCGRSGKIADTCYCFWNVGALTILGKQDLVNVPAMRRYLLEKVNHIVGGFGKAPGELPDVLHSYLGLAALAIYHEPGLKEFDATFCFSVRAVQNLKHTAWRPVMQ
ncbi:hypothetical protein B0A52_02782 [Exophiala mesophila]|uniref:Prenyltransferase alpha-alpha toroid domain-containing protein n=1 Tax=Exophiala mesophila TaxID=212818 RepID=A0A438NDL6_EXOME|nr:hypothetical protein B0A52_02782 [Exophiala mesophila]